MSFSPRATRATSSTERRSGQWPARRLAARQPARDAAALPPCRRGSGRPRRGELRAVSRARAGVARGPAERRFRHAPAAPRREVLVLQRADRCGQRRGVGAVPYDALLDSYDPGLRRLPIDPLFAELGAELPALIQEAQERQKSLPAIRRSPARSLSMMQRRIGEQLMRAARVRFQPGAARCQPASVLRRSHGRRADHHPLQRGQLRAARSWACCMRPGTRSTSRAARRLAPSAGRACARHEHAREPVAADRDAGLPELREFLALPRSARAGGFRGRGAAWSAGEPPSNRCTRGSSRASSAWTRTRSPIRLIS